MMALSVLRAGLFAPLLLAYTAASYVIFAIPSQALLSLANALFPLWDTGYSINIDIECAAIITAILTLTYISARKQGKVIASLRTLQFAGLSVFPLGLLILLSPTESGFFFVEVGNFQAKYAAWSLWFTNEYLFIISVSVFVASTVAVRLFTRRNPR